MLIILDCLNSRLLTVECRPEEERLQETDDEGIERDSGETELDDLLTQNSNGSYTDSIKLCSLQNVLLVSIILIFFCILYFNLLALKKPFVSFFLYFILQIDFILIS